MSGNNIKVDLKDTRFKDMDWIQVAYDRAQWRALVSMEMNLRVKLNLRISLPGDRVSSGTLFLVVNW
jgi:hypothetical protein